MIAFDPQVLDALTRRLHLATVRRLYPDIICDAERESWPYGVLHDGELARAILDRTLHIGEHINLDGPSWRLKGKTGIDITQDEGE
jgi:hypothetical protein